MPKFDSSKDYYNELDLKESATGEEIDRAYRTEARKRHPDGGGSEESMKRLNEAHDVLSDPESRKAYDAERGLNQTAFGSAAFDPDAASKAGTLSIPVSDGEYAGLLLSATACFGLGLPLLLLVEMQWEFYLWPLRLMSLAALVIGVYVANAALRLRLRRSRECGGGNKPGSVALQQAVFWFVAVAGLGFLVFVLYVNR